MDINTALAQIQRDLKAPKNQYNSFGKYKYRSCEDIVEGVKKVMPEGYSLIMQDQIIEVGGRVYVEATASLICKDHSISSTASAREPEDKKGMDASQITGTASSYARKYALNGLFCIDDTKDSDSGVHADEPAKQAALKTKVVETTKAPPRITKAEYDMLTEGLNEAKTLDELKAAFDNVNAAAARMEASEKETLTKLKEQRKNALMQAPLEAAE